MSYLAVCPICKKERYYDNSIHLYLPIRGEREYVCVYCESLLRMKRKIQDPQDSRITYCIEKKAIMAEAHTEREIPPDGIFVKRITWTEF